MRDGRQSTLKVDGEKKAYGSSPGEQYQLPSAEYMYFGGYPGHHEFLDVTNKDFEGCLDHVTIENLPVLLSEAVETRYTMVGCPTPRFGPSVASFFGEGFVQVPTEASPVSGIFSNFCIILF